MKHNLKILPEFYEDVALGIKSFELRYNDRDFKQGDFLILNKWDPVAKLYLEGNILAIITFVFSDIKYGLAMGYVILGIKVISATEL